MNIKNLKKKIMESNRKDDIDYFRFLIENEKKKISNFDIISQIPLYQGEVSIGRYLQLYEIYKKVSKLSGDYAEFGVWKGSTFIYMAKLIKIFEPNSRNMIYGFDWFKGLSPKKNEDKKIKGKYLGNKKNLENIIYKSNLDTVAKLININIAKKIKHYIKKNNHLRFKYVFLDCGTKDVVESVLKYVWPKIINGGVLVIDHYNDPNAPFESDLVDKYCGKRNIQSFTFSRSPSAFIIK